MRKRLISALLVALLLCLTMPALAMEYSPLLYCSDFENGASVTKGETTYSYTDGVWDISNNSAERATAYSAQLSFDRLDLAVVPESTDSDNHVLEATQWGSVALATRQIAFDETVDAVYTSFRFKIPSGSGKGQWQIGAGGHYTETSGSNVDTSLLTVRDNNKIYVVDQSQSPQIAAYARDPVAYQRDVWYTAIVYVSQNTRAAYIYDDGRLLIHNVVVNDNRDMVVARADLRNWCNTNYLADGLTIQVDDGEIMAVKKANDSLMLTAQNIADGTTEVSRTPSFELTFSRPLAAEQTGHVTIDGSTEGILVENTAPNKLKVSVTRELDFSTEYVLDFSEICDMTGNRVSGKATLAFTTLFRPLSVYPVSVSLDKKENLVQLAPIDLPLKNHSGISLPVNFFVSFYRNTAAGQQMIGVDNLSMMVSPKAASVQLPLSGSYHDLSQIKVLALDPVNNFSPMIEPVTVAISEDVPVYNIDRYEKQLIFKQDFEGNPLPSNVTTQYHYSADQIDPTGGVGGGGAYWVDGASEIAGQGTLSYVISDLDIPAGTGIMMVAKQRALNISGSVAEAGGNDYAEGCRTTMTIKNTEQNESKSIYMIDETINGTTDWIASMQYTICDFDVDRVAITCYLEGTVNQGEAWYDDVCLYTVAFDPFIDAVLEQPTYKGFIYGEGKKDDIRLLTHVQGYNIYDLENSVVTAKITDVRDNILAETTVSDFDEELAFVFSSDALTMGQDYYLKLSLNNTKTGVSYGKREWVLRKRPADYRPNNYFDEYGRYVIDGKPTFLMGIYGENELYELIDTIEGSPINVIWPYGYIWIPVRRDAFGQITTGVDTALLDYAESKGIKMTAPLGNFLYSKVSSTGNFSKVIKSPADTRTVLEGFAKALDHPAILGYYLADEMSSHRFGAEVEWANRILSDLDPDGITFNATSRAHDQREQLRFADSVNTSSYPINLGDGTDDLSKVTEHISEITKYLPQGNRPHFAVLQSYKKGSALRGPDEAEMRNMAFQAICAGMQGIIWYNGFQMEESGWNDLLAVCEEIEDYYPMLLSAQRAPIIETEAGNWFVSIAKRYGIKNYLFTANTSCQSQTARVQVGNARSVKGLHTGRTYTPDAGGWVTVSYDAIGVEVLEIKE